MGPPTPNLDFVETKIFSAALQKMKDPKVASMTFRGPAGTGKSTLATELCAKMWPMNIPPDNALFKFQLFNCAKLEDFYHDLVHFYQDINKTQDRLSSSHTKTWNILQTLFEDMNKYFPNHVKLFILDDVEPIKEVLVVVDLICRMIQQREPSLESRWKILLTTQENPARTTRYSHIGNRNFFNVDGFDEEEVMGFFRKIDISLIDTDVREIIDILGKRPLILQICVGSLKEAQGNVSESIQNLLREIGTQVSALDQSDRENPLTSALVGVKVSIKRLLDKLPYQTESLQVIKMLTLLNERNITMELLVSCAETAVESPNEAAVMIKGLINAFIERGVCTKRLEEKVPLFRLHQLVKQSMMLFVGEEEKITLIKDALVALTRVMPKDDRTHQTRLVGFYGDHGKSLDRAIKDTKGHTPFILLLHCSMLTSMGYCHLAQRTGDYKEGVELLKEARNKFCHLAVNSDYDLLLSQRGDPALRLFEASKNLGLLEIQSYKQYIAALPRYHRLTKKDLDNMVKDPSTNELVNDHLTRYDLEMFERNGKVVSGHLLAQVYIAEVLAQIYSVWSTVHRKRADYDAARAECIVQGEAAVQIYNRIFEEYKVYLLAGLITERDMLSTKLQAVVEIADVREMNRRLQELSTIGGDARKKNAYEAGLVRSDLSKDSYHVLLCKQSILKGLGRLHDMTENEEFYEEGKGLFDEVIGITGGQRHKHSALSYSYKYYANFLYNCKKYGEAVVSILRAMSELHRSLRNGGPSSGHPELSHPKFKSLYSCLQKYYNKYSEERPNEMTARGETSVRDEEKLLDEDMEEAIYLTSAMKWWRDITNAGGSLLSAAEPVTMTTSQPTESNDDLQDMETILEREIKTPRMSVEATGP